MSSIADKISKILLNHRTDEKLKELDDFILYCKNNEKALANLKFQLFQKINKINEILGIEKPQKEEKAENSKLSFNDKISLIKNSQIELRNLMNNEEKYIFNIFKNHLKEKKELEIFAQVPPSAFINKINENDEAWKAYSNFRFDFLICKTHLNDKGYPDRFEPLLVIEYLGSGHYGIDDKKDNAETIKENDEIKRVLFQKLGLKYLFIKEDNVKKKELNKHGYRNFDTSILNGLIQKIIDDIIQL